MTCDERQDLMLPYAADLLDEGQREEIRAHLASGCEKCNAALAEAQAMLDQIPASVDPVAPPADAVGRLMQRVKAENAKPASSMRMRIGWIAAAAACVGLVIGGAMTHMIEQRRLDQLVIALNDRDQKLGDLQSMVQSQQLKLVSMTGGDAQSRASGRVLWDMDHNKWHVVVFNMAPPPPGREFELWFIKPDSTKIAAGMIDIDAQGNGSVVVSVPHDIGQIAIAAITDEPAGPMQPQPTGSVHLSGAVQ